MHSLIFFEYLYLEKGSLLSEAYFTGFGAKNQFTKIIPYFILFLLLQVTPSHWNFENPWSLQGSEAKRSFCLHLGQASTNRPTVQLFVDRQSVAVLTLCHGIGRDPLFPRLWYPRGNTCVWDSVSFTVIKAYAYIMLIPKFQFWSHQSSRSANTNNISR